MDNSVTIKEERLSSEEYIDFLKRTDLGSQYPKERFEERIKKLVNNVSISLVARNENKLVVGVLFGLNDFAYWLYVTDLGVDRAYERQGIGKRLMKTAHSIAGGEKNIAVYLTVNENAIPFYVTLGKDGAPKYISYYDSKNKRTKQIDLDKPHHGVLPHTHHGYEHKENDTPKGFAHLTDKECAMVDRVGKIWRETVYDKWKKKYS